MAAAAGAAEAAVRRRRTAGIRQPGVRSGPKATTTTEATAETLVGSLAVVHGVEVERRMRSLLHP